MPIESALHNDRDFTNMQMDVFDRVLRIRAANVSHRPAGCIEIDTDGENGRNAPEHTARRGLLGSPGRQSRLASADLLRFQVVPQGELRKWRAADVPAMQRL